MVRLHRFFVLSVSFFSITNSYSQTGIPTGTFPVTSGTLTTAPYIPGFNFALGDVNSDGVDDIIGINSGWSIGPNTGAFRTLMLNEDSTAYGWLQSSPAPIPPSFRGYRAATSADFNNDGKKDVVSLSAMLDLSVFLNQGQNKSTTGFTTAGVASNQNIAGVVGWTFTNQITDRVPMIPIFNADDYDGDGNQDLIIGFNFIHYWQQNFMTPGLLVFWGRGDGTFDPVQVVPTQYAAIDLKFVDWDNNGTRETLAYLSQDVLYVTQYTAQVEFFQFQGANKRNVNPVGQPLWVGGNTVTAFDILPGATPGEHILAFSGHSFPTSYDMQPEIYLVSADNNYAWMQGPTPMTLPYHPYSGVDGDLQGLKSADLNGDGIKDLIVLYQKEFALNAPVSSLAPAEVLFVAGPIDVYGNHGGFGTLSFPGTGSVTQNFPLRDGPGALAIFHPNKSFPGILQLGDLNSDNTPDIFVGGIVAPLPGSNPNNSVQMAFVSLVNYSTFGFANYSRVDRIPGTGTAPPHAPKPRCGVSHGRPTLGNSGFKITLRDASPNGIAALWGAQTQISFNYNGLDFGLIPESFSNVYNLSGTQPGDGKLDFDLNVPNHPSLLGVSAYFQWVIIEGQSSAPWPVYCSDTIGVTVGQ